MTRLKYALSALILVAFSATAFAEDNYDAWNCNEVEMLKGIGLQCVSCGVQQYYSDHGKNNVVPSSKWIALLAANARQFRNLTDKSTPTGKGTVETDNMKKVVISQIQAYGFCTKYISRDAMAITGGKKYRDMSDPERKFIVPFINSDKEKSQVAELAKAFGFKNKSTLGIEYGQAARENMQDMFDDHHLNGMEVVNKRAIFKKKLNDAISDYDISGEKKNSSPDVIGVGDKDNGLRECLEQVQQRLNSPEFSDNNLEFCGAMAKACGLESGFCSAGNRQSSQPTQQNYRPSSGLKPLGPPPGSSRNSGTN